MEEKMYLCIDLKSFFASVECVERGLDSLKSKLVVADSSRGNGTICLAVSPALKELGVKNRCRLYEVPKNIDFIIATPRMATYIKYSADIYSIYLKYISCEDILVYSIDECFLDVTSYLHMYKKTAKELAKIIIDDVYKTTGICATVGIGTNLYLAKIALDITAKHVEDHMGFLDEDEFKRTLWHHKPLTDFWNIGPGIARRLAKLGIYDMYDITTTPEYKIYDAFGINGEFIIDHAYGKESCTIKEVHDYKPESNSMSFGQVLFSDYSYEDGLLVVKEMVELGVLDLVDKGVVTNSIGLYIGYSKDEYRPTGGNVKLNELTNSQRKLNEYFVNLYKKSTNPNYKIRRISISFNNVIDEAYASYDLFSDYKYEQKEHKMQQTIIAIKNKYGKNSIVKAMNLKEKATTITRNKLIGGHNAK